MADMPRGITVEEWNDQLAADHDIDDYYARASVVVRAIERRRLGIIRRLVAARPGERLIEVGCGGGHVLALFPDSRLVGIDVSSAMLEKAERRLDGLDVKLYKGELDDLDLEPGSFDAAICTEVLEHVVDPDAVLNSIRPLIKHSGRIVVTFPNDALIHRGKRIVKRSGLGALPMFGNVDWGGDRYHLHSWTISEMQSLLARHFEVAQAAFAPTRATPIRCCFLARPKGSPSSEHQTSS